MNETTTIEPSVLKSFAAQVALEVEQTMRDDLARSLDGCDPLLIEVMDYALFSGGKRIRPLLVILSARCCGVSDPSLTLLAAAFEYLHVATLIHDDVIDNARERRGRSSVFDRYGLGAAILAGDWLHARSMDLIGCLAGGDGLVIFSRATSAMVDGEFLQSRYVADIDVTEEHYFAVIDRKTAGLIGTACEIGALYAGADEKQVTALKKYGYRLGQAFQVIDDLLDYQGDARKTGKKIGNDFVEGKMTLPLIRAMKQSEPEERQELIRLLSGNRSAPEHFEKIRELILKNNGFSSAFETASRLSHEAVRELELFTQSHAAESRSILQALALYVISRNK